MNYKAIIYDKHKGKIEVEGPLPPNHGYCLHRIDGPALMEYADGHSIEAWYLNGRLHRTNGPSWIDDKGSYVVAIYFLHGQQYSDHDIWKKDAFKCKLEQL